jgi:hypothetical protein
VPTARRIPLVLVLGIFLAGTLVGTAVFARALAHGRGPAWSAPRPPRRGRFVLTTRQIGVDEQRAAQREREAARPARPDKNGSVLPVTDFAARHRADSRDDARRPTGSAPLRC